MKLHLFKGLFLLGVGSCMILQAFSLSLPSEEVSLRHHSQWKVADRERKKLQKEYGFHNICFDEMGEIVAKKLTPLNESRFLGFYRQCMGDGCLYCDADEGSCDAHNCGGPTNAACKPFRGEDGRPLCGEGCAYYAYYRLR